MHDTKIVRCAGQDFTIHGDPSDLYFQNAQTHADGLKPLAQLVERHVHSDGLMIDVGANIGLSTIALAATRPACPIIAIDPSPINVRFLRRNLTANGFRNVEVIEAAISDHPESLNVHQSGAWTHVVGAAHMLPNTASISVKSETLDNIAFKKGKTTFIKIDTEGHEPHVLAGARKILERDRPLMMIEFHSWCLTGVTGISPAAFAQVLWQRFEVARVNVEGELSPADRSAHDFLHSNMTARGLVEDLVVRLRAPASAPSLEQMSLPAAYVDELERLRSMNSALLASTSWQITAPIRRVIAVASQVRDAASARRRSRPGKSK